MFFGLPEKDTMKEDVQRQKFVHGLVSHLSQVPTENMGTNMSRSNVISNILDPVPGPRRQSRLDELRERIKRVQEKLDITEERIKESETSKKQLSEKLKMLETKISPASILVTDHPTEHGVAEWTRLTQAMKEAEERAKKIKELEVKERTIREGLARVQNLLTKTGSDSSLPP